MLQGSQANSKQKFERERKNAHNSREGWKAVLAEINANDVAENGPVAAGAGYDVTSNLRPGGGASWTV
jgi:hypothetical protein